MADPANPLFELWETVLAAQALHRVDAAAHAPVMARAVRFLDENALPDGLLCHSRRCKGVPCLETSAEQRPSHGDAGPT